MTEAPDATTPTGVSTTMLMAVAGIAAPFLALIGERSSSTTTTVVCSLVGIVPWVLVMAGVRVPAWMFAAIGVPAGVATVVVADNTGGMFPLMLVLVWLTRASASLLWPIVTAGAAFAAIVANAVDNGADDSGIVYFTGGLAISWLCGALLRRQEAMTAQIEAMRDAQVEQLAASERARIAREVHDVVAHSLTVVMLNLTGARRALATAPERADEALARAEVVGRDSLDSIREVMAVLHDPAPGAPLPHPTIDRLPELVAGFRTGGLAVELDAGDVGPVDPTVQLVVYRLVQESLSNVLQHAPGAAARVAMQRVGDRVDVTVENGAPTGTPARQTDRVGLGTRGMGERVRSVGGTFSAGPTPGGGWRVAARLPAPFLAASRSTPT